MDEATHKKNFKPINIRDLFMDKSPRIARWIPGFDKRFTPGQWASYVQDYTYSLVDDPNGEFPYLNTPT